MKLKALKLRNFRAYRGDVTIPVSDLTALVGRNDVGKSSVLDALAIFFEFPLVKLDSSDLCVYASDNEIRIGCVFSDLPDKIVLDVSSETTLDEEYLLNSDGDLEVHRVYSCNQGRVRERILAVANHPTADQADGLLQLKITDLKRRVEALGVDTSNVDLRANPPIRKAIWGAIPDLQLEEVEIELNKEDAKAIWQQLQKEMPAFALFRSDRPSTDEDAEVQDPMKLAITQAVSELRTELEAIKAKVQARALAVAERTLAKLREFDERLASVLHPSFRDEPKWDRIFKLSLTGDDEIPINKRGSGVRRLVLLSFLRAEAERKRTEAGRHDIIYAIEEPETSQHPENQKLLIDALKDLSEQDGCQVVLTTHVPALAGLVPVEGVRHVRQDGSGHLTVQYGTDDVVQTVANDLGVLPDKRVQVFLCVEGPTDVIFLRHINATMRRQDPSLADITSDPRIVVLPLGGSTLKDWVNEHYLRHTGLPEVHIYDRDKQAEYQSQCDALNARGDGSSGTVTDKREIENYLHPDAIQVVLEVSVPVTDDNDVEQAVIDALGQGKVARRSVKRWLNDEVAAAMTISMLRERNGIEEVTEWFHAVGALLK